MEIRIRQKFEKLFLSRKNDKKLGSNFPTVKVKNNPGYEVSNEYDELSKEKWNTFLNKKQRRKPFRKRLLVKKETFINTVECDDIKDQRMK